MIANEEAEDTVLGAMLVGGDKAIRDVLDVLEPYGERKFFAGKNGRTYAAIRDLWAEGQIIDPLVVAGRVKDVARQRLAELVALTTSTSNVAHHAGIVRDQWARRELVEVGKSLVQAAEEEPDPLGVAEAKLAAASDLIRKDKNESVVSIGDLVGSLVTDLQQPREKPNGISPPLPCMPRFYPGEITVIAGYTGHGKTNVGEHIAAHACEQGLSVTFHTLEMSKEILTQRFASRFGVPLGQLRLGQVQPAYWPMLLEAGQRMQNWKLRIIDDSEVLAADIRRYQRALRSDLIIVDHLHEFQLNARSGDHRLALDAQLHQLLALAKGENVPVVLLAQLRRKESLSGTPFPRPHLSDLKESGAIEQKAAYVGFIWRQTDEDGAHLLEAEWIVGKDRNSAVMPPTRLVFVPQSMSYRQP